MVGPTNFIILLGLSGTGKSTLAPRLATDLGLQSVDLDHRVEVDAGTDIADIFATKGEPAFRSMELAELRAALAGPQSVIATGGGIVTIPEACELIAERSMAIWLTADVEVLAKRVQTSSQKRPLVQPDDSPSTSEGAENALRKLLGEREHLYAELADVTIDVTNLNPDDVLMRVRNSLGSIEGGE